MPKIITKNPEKERIDPLQRTKFLSKDDLKTTFAYGIVGVAALITLYGVGWSFIKQVHKD